MLIFTILKNNQGTNANIHNVMNIVYVLLISVSLQRLWRQGYEKRLFCFPFSKDIFSD